jgi:hypothetical protein
VASGFITYTPTELHAHLHAHIFLASLMESTYRSTSRAAFSSAFRARSWSTSDHIHTLSIMNSITCYVLNAGRISTNVNWWPCGDLNSTTTSVPCCYAGDYCLTNGLCHYTHSLDGGSGYYAGACTNSGDAGPGCPNLCTDQNVPDAIYNSSTNFGSAAVSRFHQAG